MLNAFARLSLQSPAPVFRIVLSGTVESRVTQKEARQVEPLTLSLSVRATLVRPSEYSGGHAFYVLVQ